MATRTIVARLDGREVGRYQLNHGGYAHGSGHIEATDRDFENMARDCLADDGFAPEEVAKAELTRLD